MTCKVHDQPQSMTCFQCARNMCPMCAEYIDGRWFCPRCAAGERSIAVGIGYEELLSVGAEDTTPEEEPVQG
jgi:hypothetical protein